MAILETVGTYVPYGVGIIIALILVCGFKRVRPLEKGVVERFGKFNRVVDEGLHYVLPFVDKIYFRNLTERMMDVAPQEVITKDNLNAKVDLVVYFKVKNDHDSVKKSFYNVDKFERQIVSLAQTTARNVIGTMLFKDVNSERNKINSELAGVLDTESDAWGVQIVRVEMKEITPPEDVQEVMNKVLKAENEKIAAKDFATATETEADGQRRASIKIAEGEKKAAILTAEGIARGKIIVAKGEAERLQRVHTAANKFFIGNAQLLRQLDVTQTSLKDNTKVVLTEQGISPNIILGEIPISSKKKK